MYQCANGQAHDLVPTNPDSYREQRTQSYFIKYFDNYNAEGWLQLIKYFFVFFAFVGNNSVLPWQTCISFSN